MQRRLLFVATMRGFRDLTGGRKGPRPEPNLSEPERARNSVKFQHIGMNIELGLTINKILPN